jgi:hypothetical protein
VTERPRERRERSSPDAPASQEPERPSRPRRPVGVELAAAIMVVSGLIATLISIEAAMSLSARGELDDGLAIVSIAIGIAFVILGVLVRTGRAWLVAVNVAAIAGFLELISGSAVGFLFGALDVLVVVLLMRDRPWFHGPGEEPEEDPG